MTTTENSRADQKCGNIYATILAGGIGSRFWPLSRETTPKHLLKVVGDETLLVSTLARLSEEIPRERVTIVTSEKQVETIKHQLLCDGVESPSYVVEPMMKNTAPAIGLAAIKLLANDPDAIMAVLPADHLIPDGESFCRALKAAARVAEEGHIVTFGIVPKTPETGYGYIKGDEEEIQNSDGFGVKKVQKFVEKPDIDTARGYLASGDYYWNSGIFVWKASKIMEEIERYLPAIYTELKSIADGERSVEEAYERMESISIDNGILERTTDCVVIEADFPWSDMGSWSSLWEIGDSDAKGNVINHLKGRVVDIDSENSLIMGCDRVVATVGLKDMIVVDTPDATLICPRDRAQEVKDLVGILKNKGWAEHVKHPTVEKPWGSYTVLEEGTNSIANYVIKKICVKPGKRLSLQSHIHRSEHWVVISGVAMVQKDEEIRKVSLNESIDIPKEVKHRLENRGTTMLEIIEVQNGERLEESDIVRYEDDFGRNTPIVRSINEA